MSSEALDVTLRVTTALDALGVRNFVGGSMAAAVHGSIRSSLDSDIVAELRPEHVGPLLQRLGAAFYADPIAMGEAIEARSSFNLIHLETMFKVDVFVSRERAFDRSQFSRRKAWPAAAESRRSAFVASAEDTILSKLEWFRAGDEVSEHQWRDVQGVLQVQGHRLDTRYLSRWATELGVADLLERALTEAGLQNRAGPSVG